MMGYRAVSAALAAGLCWTMPVDAQSDYNTNTTDVDAVA